MGVSFPPLDCGDFFYDWKNLLGVFVQLIIDLLVVDRGEVALAVPVPAPVTFLGGKKNNIMNSNSISNSNLGAGMEAEMVVCFQVLGSRILLGRELFHRTRKGVELEKEVYQGGFVQMW